MHDCFGQSVTADGHGDVPGGVCASQYRQRAAVAGGVHVVAIAFGGYALGTSKALQGSGALHRDGQFALRPGLNRAVFIRDVNVEEAEILRVRFQNGFVRRDADAGFTSGAMKRRAVDFFPASLKPMPVSSPGS